ncbi:MAG: TldD/PmbA family protein [Leptospirales bacterium]|nr:TldD/PmbA family protein [Leptospirales bacterium]
MSLDSKAFAEDVVKEVMRQGADACDVVAAESSEFSVQLRLGKIEKLEESISRGLGIRVFKNQAVAITHTTDFGDKSVKSLVRDALSILRVSDSDPANGLAARELLGKYDGKLNLTDTTIASILPEKKIEMARACEAAGLAFDKRIVNSDGTGWSDSHGRFTLANSDGFVGQYEGTSVGISASLLAEEGGVKQTDYWYSYDRFFSKLDAPESIGKEAARRTVARLGARKVKSQTAQLVVDPLVSRRFVGMIFSAASGGSIYRKSSFLFEKLGKQIGSALLNIVDDATLPDGPASRPFDGEGLPSRRMDLVRDGVLLEMPCESYSARKLGRKPTGNAVRGYQSSPVASSSNLYMLPGKDSPDAIIGSVKSGLYVTQLMGMGFNGVTGDLSQGAAGFWIENGALSYPVQEITIAGNFLEMLGNLTAVGNDVSFKMGSTAAPTLLISSVTIGGD